MWSSPDNPNGIILVYQVIYYGYKPLPETKEKRVCGDSTPITFFCACVHVSFIYQLSVVSSQQESEKIDILDGPKVIDVPAKEGRNPVYTLIINDLVAGLVYDIKVSSTHSSELMKDSIGC